MVQGRGTKQFWQTQLALIDSYYDSLVSPLEAELSGHREPGNTYVPQMKNKGRIRVGADADITIFDADRVIDRATFEKPMQPSEGIVQVLVGGVFVVRNSELVDSAFPGQAITRQGTAER